MRKTAITKTIDDLKIVTGFDIQRVNPVATRKIISAMLEELDESKRLTGVASSLEDRKLALKTAIRNKDNIEIENISAEIASLESQIETLRDLIRQKQMEFLETEAIYFAPPSREYILTDEEAADLELKFGTLKPNHFLLRDGSIIEDLRGSDYWEKVDGKWRRSQIEKLGETIDGSRVSPENLKQKDIDEIETQRIGDLSEEDKKAEKDRLLEAATNAAVLMRGRLELEDDAEALTKAKAFLSEKKSEIESLYS